MKKCHSYEWFYSPQNLNSFSVRFTNCIDEQSSTENCVIVHTTAQNKNEVTQRFACIAGVSYVVDKHVQGRRRQEGISRKICQVTTSTEINAGSPTVNVLSNISTKRQAASRERTSVFSVPLSMHCFIGIITFTGTHNHYVQTADSTSAEAKAATVDNSMQVLYYCTLVQLHSCWSSAVSFARNVTMPASVICETR